MKKLFVVVSEETNKVGLYELENGTPNCLASIELNWLDADNVKYGMIDWYVFTNDEGERLQEDEMTADEFAEKVHQCRMISKEAILIDSDEFHEMLNKG